MSTVEKTVSRKGAKMLDRRKYMNRDEITKLRTYTEAMSLRDLARGRERYVRSWMIIDVLTSCGIRASECRHIKLADVNLSKKEPMLRVNGKGSNGRGPKIRHVNVPTGLRKHLAEFLQWKKLVNDDMNEDAYLFPSSKQGKAFSLNGIQKRFKVLAREAGLPGHHSLHSCRHSYGTYLFEKTKNLRLVQKELGHSNIATTTIYADVTAEQCAESVNGLWV